MNIRRIRFFMSPNISLCGDLAEGVSFDEATARFEAAVEAIHSSDLSVRSVGICRRAGGFGYHVVRAMNVSGHGHPPSRIQGVPVATVEVCAEVTSLAKLPRSGKDGTVYGSGAEEREMQRPLRPGLQIQNFDDDLRQGTFGSGLLSIGSIGCFVRTREGHPALLSNNHGLAGENRGVQESDRILQPGSSDYHLDQHVATLSDLVELRASPHGARPHLQNVTYNSVDAAVATLVHGVGFTQRCLEIHVVPPLTGTATGVDVTRVFKVGSTTGLTFGTVMSNSAVVGPVLYEHGECWFQRSIVVQGEQGRPFADYGDSGAAVASITGEVIGLLYASNGTYTYVCPIDDALRALGCTFAEMAG